MNFIKERPYILFLILIVILLSFGFYKGEETIVINIHDTYFVISWRDLMIMIASIYGFLSLVYLALIKLNFNLLNWMTVSHVLISLMGLLAIFTLPMLIHENLPMDFSAVMENAKFNERIGYGIWLSFFSLAVGQLLFFCQCNFSFSKTKN